MPTCTDILLSCPATSHSSLMGCCCPEPNQSCYACPVSQHPCEKSCHLHINFQTESDTHCNAFTLATWCCSPNTLLIRWRPMATCRFCSWMSCQRRKMLRRLSCTANLHRHLTCMVTSAWRPRGPTARLTPPVTPQCRAPANADTAALRLHQHLISSRRNISPWPE